MSVETKTAVIQAACDNLRSNGCGHLRATHFGEVVIIEGWAEPGDYRPLTSEAAAMLETERQV